MLVPTLPQKKPIICQDNIDSGSGLFHLVSVPKHDEYTTKIRHINLSSNLIHRMSYMQETGNKVQHSIVVEDKSLTISK